jgi:hypothetical protein
VPFGLDCQLSEPEVVGSSGARQWILIPHRARAAPTLMRCLAPRVRVICVDGPSSSLANGWVTTQTPCADDPWRRPRPGGSKSRQPAVVQLSQAIPSLSRSMVRLASYRAVET